MCLRHVGSYVSPLVLDKGVCGLHTLPDVWRNVGRAGCGSTHDDSGHQGRSARYTTLTARVGMRRCSWKRQIETTRLVALLYREVFDEVTGVSVHGGDDAVSNFGP